jgi:bacterioferritin-associated ferredoxin
MYVCLCKGVTDRQIQKAVQDGATTIKQLRNCLGVTSQCGKCGITAREILNEALESVSENNAFGLCYAVG